MGVAAAVAVTRDVRVGDGGEHTGEPAGILFDGECVRDIGPPGLAAPEGAEAVDAEGMLTHPGPINGDTHDAPNMAKGARDRRCLELLPATAPWTGGNHGPRRRLSRYADPHGGDLPQVVATGKTASSEHDRTADAGPGPDLAHHCATLTSVNADQRRSNAPVP
jgi:hypothetical protein